MTAVERAAARRYRGFTGRAPDGLWSAPGRVNLIGEHTDYNDGFVLPFAIDRRTVVALGRRDDGLLRVATTRGGETITVPLAELDTELPTGVPRGWSAYPLGVAWALGRAGAELTGRGGADLVIHSDVPVGAGLSSSAAIESAVALALDEIWEVGLDRPALAQIGRRAENDAVGAPTGIMDQSASLLGQADAAVFLDCRSLETEVVPLGLDGAGLTILVIDTRVAHAHAHGGYQERRASCEAGAAALGVASLRDVSIEDLGRAEAILDDVTFRRVRHVVTENQRVLDTVAALRSGGPTTIGPLLDASHRSMRDDFEISVPELDLAVDTAIAAGAVGARMTGGGFGGSAIALVAERDMAQIADRARAAFSAAGYAAPEIFTVRPSDGARRVA